ncbi:hypothetical protein MMC07_005615 [Pseudocyphellaria aurata]|nr:hypothetical protein [Pseudocyphellaria aurata]
MSHSKNEEFISNIFVGNVGTLRSDEKTVIDPTNISLEGEIICPLLSSNSDGFVADLKPQTQSQINTIPKDLRNKSEAAAAWKAVVEKNLPKKR